MNRQQRRASILSDVQQQMRSLHRRRRRWRVCFSTIGLALGLFGAWQFHQWRSPTNGNSGNDLAFVNNEQINQQQSATENVSSLTENRHNSWISQNSPGVIDRYVVSGSRGHNLVTLTNVDDDELLYLLQLAGKPGHLGIIDGQKTVIPLKTL